MSASGPELSFRDFLSFGEIKEFMNALSSGYPGFCKSGSIGMSRQGREIPLLTVTDFSAGAAEDKPAYLVHANIHAAELAGTHAALHTAGRLLADKENRGLLRDVVFHIIPRVNPDGAEYVLETSGPLRSRMEQSRVRPNTLLPSDVDGDGLVLSMRFEHPDGEYAVYPGDRRILVRRRADSPGPFYRLLPEGLIKDWDGTDGLYCGGRVFDWNRNWSYDWRPEYEQPGAGDFPFSETEMRCLAEFIHGKENLFGILGYHTGPAAVLRPPSTGSEEDLDAGDLRTMEDLANFGSESTGFPVIPVIRYHNARSRDGNLRGHFHDFGYHHLGLFVFEFELGTIKNSAGISTGEQFSAENEEEEAEQLAGVLKWWDGREPGGGMLFKNWEEFNHPQLGLVETGGFLRSVFANPAVTELERISEGTYRFTVEHARKHPRIVLEDVSADRIEGDIFRIRARLANRGEFPSYISNRGRGLRRIRPLQAGFYPSEGVRLLSARGHLFPGHLEGMGGRRLEKWFVSAPGEEGRGEDASVLLEWFVRAPGEKACSCLLTVSGGAGGNVRHNVRLNG